MKRILFSFVLAMACTFSAAGKDKLCVAQKIKGWTYRQNRLQQAVYVEYFNSLNRHILSFIQWQCNEKRGPQLQCRLNIPGAYGNYSDPLPRFMEMEVNGFKLEEISFNKDDVKVWKKSDGTTGADFPLNFDGTQIILRAYIRPGSGALFLNFKLDPKSITPFKGGKIQINNCTSGLHLNEKGGAVWAMNKYARMAISPVNTYTQKNRKVTLKPEDKYLLLMDTTLPGNGDKKKVRRDHGPSVFIPDPRIPTTLTFGIYSRFVMTLDRNFKETTIGVWQKRQIITNDQLKKLIKEQPRQFTL